MTVRANQTARFTRQLDARVSINLAWSWASPRKSTATTTTLNISEALRNVRSQSYSFNVASIATLQQVRKKFSIFRSGGCTLLHGYIAVMESLTRRKHSRRVTAHRPKSDEKLARVCEEKLARVCEQQVAPGFCGRQSCSWRLPRKTNGRYLPLMTLALNDRAQANGDLSSQLPQSTATLPRGNAKN